MANVVVRTLLRSPQRLQIRSNLFCATTLGVDGRSTPLPALEHALTSAREIRRRTGRPVWVESPVAPAYVRPPTRNTWDRFVQALRGRDGTALVARIKAHPLAPACEGSQGGVTRHQLAMILATAKASKWRPAAEAVAREEGFGA